MTCAVERLPDSGDIERYRMSAGALVAEVITVGCAITRLDVPDRTGRPANVVLAHRDFARYRGPGREYFGAMVGRVANRVARGRFELDGREHALATNDGTNHLHGGAHGFDRRVWAVEEAFAGDVARLRLRLRSADGEEGYPGALAATVSYTLSPDGELRLDGTAATDAPTLVNLTNHSYFNLAGTGDVLGHELTIAADAYCPVDATLVPTGELRAVDETPFDFRAPAVVGDRLRAVDPQLRIAGGFDHCWALRGWDAASRSLRAVAELRDRHSGRRLRLATDQPGLQFYSGNFLDGTAVGPDGRAYGRHAGLCLETQRFPDAPHHPRFPSIVLRPGERYATATTWRFDV